MLEQYLRLGGGGSVRSGVLFSAVAQRSTRVDIGWMELELPQGCQTHEAVWLQATTADYANKLYNTPTVSQSSRFSKPKLSPTAFTIEHYAGAVRCRPTPLRRCFLDSAPEAGWTLNVATAATLASPGRHTAASKRCGPDHCCGPAVCRSMCARRHGNCWEHCLLLCPVTWMSSELTGSPFDRVAP